MEQNKNRVFSIADRVCPSQPVGGPGGVNYRLLLANKKYGYIDNMHHIFKEMIVEENAILKLTLMEKANDEVDRLKKYFMKLDEYYRFTDNDIFIFHDVMSAYVFISNFSVSKTILVYHQQGSLYKEWESFTGKQDAGYRDRLDLLLIRTMNAVMYVAFPSKGSILSVIDSAPLLGEFINGVKTKILYNGCDRINQPKVSTDAARQVIETLKVSQIPNFVTTAALNEAKGVERIPEFLSAFHKKYGEFNWIVVGDGIKAAELEQNIDKYGIKDQTIWIRDRIPHDDMLAIFEHTDFYILAHRFSIFDFATIEAMGYGNIPILTPVGGNKEVIIDNNGIFLNDLSTTADFDDFVMEQNFEAAKEKNISITNELFSEKAFIKGYADLIDEIRREG